MTGVLISRGKIQYCVLADMLVVTEPVAAAEVVGHTGPWALSQLTEFSTPSTVVEGGGAAMFVLAKLCWC